ncbi:MAG: MmcQ/YjbR family DNA-binding protein [Acidobacteria bacterium]|nr:MAG: MmcQ/YjbR family DNA-binding protein [Acidobacteriota bacterium]
MKRPFRKRRPAEAFAIVRTVGLGLPNVEATTKYDGSPVLKLGGCFMAGLATHRSAEPDTLVVRVDLEEREWLLEDAPETYYVTDYYRNYPIVLVRLSRVDRVILRELLSVSWRLTLAKARKRPRTTQGKKYYDAG